MILKKIISVCLFLLGICVWVVPVALAGQHRILYVDSYHQSYPWSAGITRGIQSVLEKHPEIELKIERMDSKRISGEEDIKSAALKVKGIIDSWQPDIVIASDDNASKYLIVPYFMGADLPFVFCGVNWDASSYGFPTANITGMVEVQLIDQIIAILQDYASGSRIAFIKGDDLSAQIEADFFEKRFDIQLDRRFVSDFSTWKEQYLVLQKEADMILLGNSVSIKGWNPEEAQAFIMEATVVPTGNWDAWMAPYSLVTLANMPEEQGEWAATTALRILSGTPPSDIPIATNEKAKIYLNMELAKKIGVKFPIELIERATFTSELEKQ